jgi:hypothetical protein
MGNHMKKKVFKYKDLPPEIMKLVKHDLDYRDQYGDYVGYDPEAECGEFTESGEFEYFDGSEKEAFANFGEKECHKQRTIMRWFLDNGWKQHSASGDVILDCT